MPTTKQPPPPPPPPVSLDSDDEFEELHAICSRKKAEAGAEGVSHRSSGTSITPDLEPHNSSRNPPAPSGRGSGADAAKTLSSSPAMTKVYMPRTSDAGFGYFTEVEATREEADRMVREDALAAPPDRPRRPGSFRVWRQSEVPILDLTGED